MSWRWRKAIGAGPFRINLSRGGLGWSCGLPGFRYGVTPAGRRYVSFGFPGLGLYWMRYLDSEQRRSSDRPVAHPVRSARSGQIWRERRDRT